jgi:hypothetical protein
MLEEITSDLTKYLANSLGIKITVTPWRGVERLPHYLKSSYRFVSAKLLNLNCLFMIDLNDQEQPPAVINKRLTSVQEKCPDEIIYVRERITTYNRKRLIEHKVPFIVPGNQLYLPMLAMDIREHLKKLRSKTTYLGPAAQALLIHLLLNEPDQVPITPSVIAPRLRCTVMTASRAFDELESFGIGEILMQGRRRCLKITNRRDEWKKAMPFLRSPVVSSYDVTLTKKIGLEPISGFSGLAHYSNLAEPTQKTIAMDSENWRGLKKQGRVVELAYPEPESIKIEVWRYNPDLFAKEGVTDPLSVFLSLRNETDERVESSLGEMMDDISWLKG